MPIWAALHEMQQSKYGKIKAISVHCAMSWGGVVLKIEELIDTKDALRTLVEGAAWREVSKSSQNAGAICHAYQRN